MHSCHTCPAVFLLKKNLNRHLRELHEIEPENSKQPTIVCHDCDDVLISQEKLIEHLIAKHSYSLKIEEKEFDNEAGSLF